MAAVPPHVLAAYGVAGPAQALGGGQGTSVVAGGLVLKPGAKVGEISWLAGVCARIQPHGFGLPAPVPARDGRLVVDGWSASTFVEGAPIDGRNRSAAVWLPVLEAGRAFHQAVRYERRPAFLDLRTHRWAVADRAAWGKAPLTSGLRSARLLNPLDGLVVDERLADQLIHGDLSGNVLLTAGLAPAVIDVSPYWRPAAYADAVLVVDALLWWHADSSLLNIGRPKGIDDCIWTSLLVRGLTFRLLSFDESSWSVPHELDRYSKVAQLLEAR